ncbi:MAG: N-acetylglucosamine kinase, partial [Oxalobacteraceae bacterium]
MTASDCFLGVDGGGTKTRFALVDGEGRLLAQAQHGTTYHPQVGLEGVAEILGTGISQVLQEAGADGTAIRYAFFGLPAYGEDSHATSLLQVIPRALLGHDRYACDNDMVCGWAGSLACSDGINIVAGTGSIGYGQRQGVAARAGGWGEAFSDEGSAYWIAVQGLNAYSRMSDGRWPKGPLH